MKPTIGRIVHYVLAAHDLDGEHQGQVGRSRPAIIVEAWGNDRHDAAQDSSAVNLLIFTDSSNDGLPSMLWKTSVLYSEAPDDVGRWHWPQRD